MRGTEDGAWKNEKMTDVKTLARAPLTRAQAPSIETRASWIAASAALGVMAVAFGAPYIAVVALKPIAADLGGARAVPAACFSLAWLGAAFGGVVMGRLANRIGQRLTAVISAVMVALGLVIASRGAAWQLYVGFGVFIGLFGLGGVNSPLYVYVSRWFDRRRGTALALISSGSYVAGAIWPSVFTPIIDHFGWQNSFLIYSVVAVALILPLSLFLDPPPEAPDGAAGALAHLALPRFAPNTVLAILSAASFLCCIPMAMPQGHLVALCSDLGIAPSHGAFMLSMLLVIAFVSRQIWGAISDRIGGLNTVLASSACQASAMAALLFTQDEAGLFVVAAAYGFGFAGIIPAYVLAIREMFPANEAHWRVPMMMLCSGTGMAVGGWVAGAIYDHYGFYGAAFAFGLCANLVNLALVSLLILRRVRPHPPTAWAPPSPASGRGPG
jgi:MFS family permease